MKAFPIPHTVVDANDPAFKLGQAGMDLRDYFAAKAMQSILSTVKGVDIGLDKGKITEDTFTMARCAYAIADAMMEVRKDD